jgi:hypothetical protein
MGSVSLASLIAFFVFLVATFDSTDQRGRGRGKVQPFLSCRLPLLHVSQRNLMTFLKIHHSETKFGLLACVQMLEGKNQARKVGKRRRTLVQVQGWYWHFDSPMTQPIVQDRHAKVDAVV